MVMWPMSVTIRENEMNETTRRTLAMIRVMVPKTKRTRRPKVTCSVRKNRTTQQSCDSYDWKVQIAA